MPQRLGDLMSNQEVPLPEDVTSGGSGDVTVLNWPGVQPVSAQSLPLPAGAATEAALQSIKTGTDRIPAVEVRTQVTMYATRIAGVTSEALLNLQAVRNGAAPAAGTSQAITNGKKLRIQAVTCSIRHNSGTAVQECRFFLRWNPAGAVAVNSPIIALAEVSDDSTVAANAFVRSVPLQIPDGLELGSGAIGITQLANGTAALVSACLIGYEH